MAYYVQNKTNKKLTSYQQYMLWKKSGQKNLVESNGAMSSDNGVSAGCMQSGDY